MAPAQDSSSFIPSMCLICYLLAVQGFLEVETREYLPSRDNQRGNEKQLLLELQDVLEKLQAKRMPAWDTKFNKVPKCIMEDTCAVRRGSRIGKLCDCPRITSCNYVFLRCL